MRGTPSPEKREGGVEPSDCDELNISNTSHRAQSLHWQLILAMPLPSAQQSHFSYIVTSYILIASYYVTRAAVHTYIGKILDKSVWRCLKIIKGLWDLLSPSLSDENTRLNLLPLQYWNVSMSAFELRDTL